jgi:MFS transporter, OFA family, oxalate/formate antiporter
LLSSLFWPDIEQYWHDHPGEGNMPVAATPALLHDAIGSWLPVFGIIIAMDILTGVLALAVLKPMRRAHSP